MTTNFISPRQDTSVIDISNSEVREWMYHNHGYRQVRIHATGHITFRGSIDGLNRDHDYTHHCELSRDDVAKLIIIGDVGDRPAF